ncbi:alpha/beta fold hydrolase [Stenotrophobium rhamnosiphilum]|uniref:Alpha/beta hydrolase n=1 Tax=Stenotrophobium rhamnosiphilum TaxID=2029166 RepID=A0A2T5MIU3_9GAMM|nr:alpha/beta hydrolase [Stenotrophobium rhamnosiphilum]PTU32459.1 alpha/beta hydrolase [Stenotrophobium rhamnosiphilum]
MIAHALDSLLNAGGNVSQVGWLPGARYLKTARGVVRVYDSRGTGPVVVMVPDGPNVIEHHKVVIELLTPHARVVCFDMPGFGFSRPGLSYDHSLKAGGETVLAVMDALEIKEAALHFSCANGFYALAAARIAPHRIRRLLLCQTPALEGMSAWVQRVIPWQVRTPVLGQVLVRATRRRVAHGWYAASLPDKDSRAPFRATADHALAHGGCFCLAGVVQGLIRADQRELEGVKQPVTLLWGDSDKSHRKTPVDSLLALVPHAQIQHFPECGHFPDLERPKQYAEISLAALSA